MSEFIFLNLRNGDVAGIAGDKLISDGALCRSCVYAHVERGYNAGEEAVFCTVGNVLRPLSFVIRDCSDFARASDGMGEVKLGFAVPSLAE